MKNYKILTGLLLLSMTLCFMGCGGGGGSDNIGSVEQSVIVSTVTRNVVNGTLNIPPTSSGMKISVQNNTLRENTEVTVEEKRFTADSTSSKLTNSDRIFEVRAVDVDNGNKAVDLLEKPMVVILPNTMKVNAKNYYVGTRENENSEWTFTQINDKNSNNNPQYLSSLRASTNGSEFYFVTNKMGFQIAIFADMNDNPEFDKMTVLEGCDFSILVDNSLTACNKTFLPPKFFLDQRFLEFQRLKLTLYFFLA